MTNYNDGNWHGWNGGKCPVHPMTEIEYVCHDAGGAEMRGPRMAGDLSWRGELDDPIIAFRVVKEYRVPREWWAHPDGEEHMLEYDSYHAEQLKEIGYIHVREVIEDDA